MDWTNCSWVALCRVAIKQTRKYKKKWVVVCRRKSYKRIRLPPSKIAKICRKFGYLFFIFENYELNCAAPLIYKYINKYNIKHFKSALHYSSWKLWIIKSYKKCLVSSVAFDWRWAWSSGVWRSLWCWRS